MKKDKIQLQKTKEYEIRASYTDEVSELEKKNRILAKEIAAEGIVLLEIGRAHV